MRRVTNNRDPLSGDPVGGVSPTLDSGQQTQRTEDHLGTTHLHGNLKTRAVSSTMVSVAAQGARFVVTAVSVFTLNRLLEPSDFGLVVMVTSVMGMLFVFKDAGLSIPTIQHEAITQAQVSNLFWINVALSTSASLLVMAAAQPLAWFYNEPRVRDVALVVAGNFVLSGMAAQPKAILSRQMRFKTIAVIDVTMVLVGALVGIAMAVAGFRYWSLVGQIVSAEVTSVVLTWSICRWRPALPARSMGTRPLLRFGANLAASNLLLALARLSDVVLLGRFFGSEAAGLYSRAYALLLQPLDQLLYALHSVFVPALSRLHQDPPRYRNAFLQTYEATALITYPATGLMLGLADPLTRLVFGPGWEGVTPIFASLAIAGVFFPLTNVSTWVFYSSGRGADWLRASTLIATLLVTAFVVGLPWGPRGVALAFSISGVFVLQPVLFYLVGRRGPVSMRDLVVGMLQFVPLWIGVAGASYGAQVATAKTSFLAQLVIGSVAGLIAGLAVVCILPPMRRSAWRLLEVVKGLGVHSQGRTAPA